MEGKCSCKKYCYIDIMKRAGLTNSFVMGEP